MSEYPIQNTTYGTVPAEAVGEDDVVQITDPEHDLYSRVLIVCEVKHRGIQAYYGETIVSLEAGQYERIGSRAQVADDCNRERFRG